MTNFLTDLDVRYVSQQEIDSYLRKARKMRARALRDSAVSIREMLQRAVSRKTTVFQPSEA